MHVKTGKQGKTDVQVECNKVDEPVVQREVAGGIGRMSLAWEAGSIINLGHLMVAWVVVARKRMEVSCGQERSKCRCGSTSAVQIRHSCSLISCRALDVTACDWSPSLPSLVEESTKLSSVVKFVVANDRHPRAVGQGLGERGKHCKEYKNNRNN